jgi:uncharacterized glyoxalase superfamily protein PhnB
MQGVVPMLAYEDAAAAIDWLARAFGFHERPGVRMLGADGRVSHAEMETGNGIIMLATPTPAYRGPRRHAESCDAARAWLSAPWVINGVLVYVHDVETHYSRARAAGARLLSEIQEAPPGRLYRVEDIEGQRWMFMQAR